MPWNNIVRNDLTYSDNAEHWDYTSTDKFIYVCLECWRRIQVEANSGQPPTCCWREMTREQA